MNELGWVISTHGNAGIDNPSSEIGPFDRNTSIYGECEHSDIEINASGPRKATNWN
jgi:hypothetical protein